MTFSRIAGTGSYLPEKILTNDDLSALVDTSDEWISSRTGIRQRHVAAEGELASDLAYEAARRAIENAGLVPTDIDLIIVATTTPDMVFPSTACILQAKLGIAGCPAFDVQAVCTGFVYALATADLYVRAGKAKNALVLGSEVFTRLLDWSDRATCVLFGDGAGAVVLQASPEPGILASRLHADGAHAGILCVRGNVDRGSLLGDPFVRMDGNTVFKLAVKALADAAEEVLGEAGVSASSVDWFIPHQANIRIMEATTRRLGLPKERLVSTVALHGNTSAASVPLALDEAVRNGSVKRGQHVLLEGVGGGFTWGAILLKW
ncbi:MAG: beta-ketoacyl-ACP synthase III [Betaproteobacteria bacterium]|nr:beta-ketoacyl-ACP synthase III [Betaproteobacteria bacterium]